MAWRAVLVIALAANPVAAATTGLACVEHPGDKTAAKLADPGVAQPSRGTQSMPSPSMPDMAGCEEMGLVPDGAPPAPGDAGSHGCSCGDAACRFAACATSSVLFMAAQDLHVAGLPRDLGRACTASRPAPSPPGSRNLRPPIA